MARDPVATRKRILNAALEVFSKKGLAGARVDEIADLAEVNKRMLYHYFGSKDGLFTAVLELKVERKQEALRQSSDTLTDNLPYWFKVHQEDSRILRLLMWEALEYDDKNSSIVLEDARSELFAQAAKLIRHSDQDAPECRNSKLMLLALIGSCTVPLLLPQLTKLVSGFEGQSDEFTQAYSEFLAKFGQTLEMMPLAKELTKLYSEIPEEDLNSTPLPSSIKKILALLQEMADSNQSFNKQSDRNQTNDNESK